MASRQRFTHSTMVVLCYLAWTAVFLGVVGSAGLWLLSEFWSGSADTSSSFQVLSDNAPLLLVGSLALTVLAGGLSYWVDRHVE